MISILVFKGLSRVFKDYLERFHILDVEILKLSAGIAEEFLGIQEFPARFRNVDDVDVSSRFIQDSQLTRSFDFHWQSQPWKKLAPRLWHVDAPKESIGLWRRHSTDTSMAEWWTIRSTFSPLSLCHHRRLFPDFCLSSRATPQVSTVTTETTPQLTGAAEEAAPIEQLPSTDSLISQMSPERSRLTAASHQEAASVATSQMSPETRRCKKWTQRSQSSVMI